MSLTNHGLSKHQRSWKRHATLPCLLFWLKTLGNNTSLKKGSYSHIYAETPALLPPPPWVPSASYRVTPPTHLQAKQLLSQPPAPSSFSSPRSSSQPGLLCQPLHQPPPPPHPGALLSHQPVHQPLPPPHSGALLSHDSSPSHQPLHQPPPHPGALLSHDSPLLATSPFTNLPLTQLLPRRSSQPQHATNGRGRPALLPQERHQLGQCCQRDRASPVPATGTTGAAGHHHRGGPSPPPAGPTAVQLGRPDEQACQDSVCCLMSRPFSSLMKRRWVTCHKMACAARAQPARRLLHTRFTRAAATGSCSAMPGQGKHLHFHAARTFVSVLPSTPSAGRAGASQGRRSSVEAAIA